MAKIPYRKQPGKIAASAVLVALIGAAAAPLALKTIANFEGYVPEAYLCPADIWTKCWGDTRDVVPGAKYTFEQCLDSINEHTGEIARYILRCVPGLKDQHPKVIAAAVSMAYNIGPTAFCKSSVADNFRKGNWQRGCERMAEIYKTAKGIPLKGLEVRRETESEMCLQGLKEGN